MFRNARTVATVGGVPLRVDPSLLLVALLAVGAYELQFDDGRGTVAALAMAVVASVLFFGSVLAHELAHALEARHRGVEVRSITLFALGGVTEMELADQRARDEFAVAAVGPWASLVLAAVLGLLAEGAGLLGLTAVADLTGHMGWTNLALALFNLIPGAPLDGGRVLRSAAWAVTGNRRLASTIAVRVGQLLGAGLAVWGVTLLDRRGGLLAAVQLLVLGAFILHGATRDHLAGRVEARLAGRTAADLAVPVLRLPADTTVELAVARAAGLVDDDVVAVATPPDGDGERGAPAPTTATTTTADTGASALASVDVVDVVTLRTLDRTDASVRTVADLARTADAAEVPWDAPARRLARTVDEHGLVHVVGPEGDRTLTSRRGVDGALRAVLDGAS